jgi:aspartate aminotransferase
MFAERVRDMKLSGVRRMFDAAPPGAVHLGIGEPDFNPSENVISAFKKAVDSGFNKYCTSIGLPILREAIAENMKKYDKEITADNVIVTVGCTEALMLTSQMFFENGDEILLPDPGFVLYEPHIQFSNAKPVHYPLLQENEFIPKQDDILNLITDRTKAIIVNSPSNPTGGVFDKDAVKMIVDIADDHNIYIISDEVYDHIVYEDEHESFLGKYENVVYTNSFSKTYAMTGWRLGYLVASDTIIKEMVKLHYYFVACPPTPTQYAALEALKGPQESVTLMVETFRKRRDLIVKELNSINGFNCIKPKGAFYVFPSFEFDITSEELGAKLLSNGLVCTPGVAFGPLGEKHLRFSYAASTENIMKGMAILKNTVKELR